MGGTTRRLALAYSISLLLNLLCFAGGLWFAFGALYTRSVRQQTAQELERGIAAYGAPPQCDQQGGKVPASLPTTAGGTRFITRLLDTEGKERPGASSRGLLPPMPPERLRELGEKGESAQRPTGGSRLYSHARLFRVLECDGSSYQLIYEVALPLVQEFADVQGQLPQVALVAIVLALGLFLALRQLIIRPLEDKANRLIRATAHEYGRSISQVQSRAGRLMKRGLEGAALADTRAIQRLCDRFGRITETLQSFTRSEATGRDESRWEWALLDPGKVLLDLLDERADAQIDTARPVALQDLVHDPVMGDENKLKQALDNLLDNAKKATLNGGTVSVGMRRAEQEVCFDVIDTGVGIPRAEIPRIFRYYYRASNRTGGGSGIGLAITWRIVHRHRGEITVRSELGRGSTFTICLPRSDYQPPPPTLWRRLAGWWAELTG